jgi:hypothetical protein
MSARAMLNNQRVFQEDRQSHCYGCDPCSALADRVNQAIQNGWQPIGGVATAVSNVEIGMRLYQAVVLTDEDENGEYEDEENQN